MVLQKFRFGQGATEYLMLLGVVLVIAMVAIAILSFFPGTASEASITESNIYWNTARVFSIKEASAERNIGCNVVKTGGYKLVMQNTALDPVTLKGVFVDNATRPFCSQNVSSPSSYITFGISEKQIIVVEFNYTSADCTAAGNFVSKSLRFVYDQGDSVNLSQAGGKNLMLRCS